MIRQLNTMGNKARQQLSASKAKIERQRCVGYHLYANCNDPTVWEKILESTIRIILNCEPLLLSCFKYELSLSPDPLNIRLYKAICETMNKLLTVLVNKPRWIWFKKFLFDSATWYENVLSTQFKMAIKKELEKQQKEGELEKQRQQQEQGDSSFNDRHLKCFCKCGTALEPIIPAVA